MNDLHGTLNVSLPSSVNSTASISSRTVFDSLIPEIRKALEAEGYSNPTKIQEKCIPHLLRGRDLLGTAQTGTGKTAAFALPLLQLLSGNRRQPWPGTPRALILAPTRELAAQIGKSIEAYGRFLPLTHCVVFGGVHQGPQVRQLVRGVDIIVATPGRLLDLMQQGHIHLEKVEIFVLDEVDRMLDMGFIPDIKKVLSCVPKERQTLFFSATMAPKMEKLSRTMVRNPARVAIDSGKPAVERIKQKVMFVGKKNKNALLVSLLERPEISKALIFTKMKHSASKVAGKLCSAGITGTAIHGNKTQAARTKALNGFKDGRFRVLVATDVAARGLDVDDITHVINYDLPMEAETYVHRIGRTARAGAGGDAISFCSSEEMSNLRSIERLIGKAVPAETEHEFHCDTALNTEHGFGKAGGRASDGKSSRTRRFKPRGRARGNRR